MSISQTADLGFLERPKRKPSSRELQEHSGTHLPEAHLPLPSSPPVHTFPSPPSAGNLR